MQALQQLMRKQTAAIAAEKDLTLRDTLIREHCSQCHAAPPPSTHTAQEWADVTGRMQEHITDKSTSNDGVMVPSSSEMASVIDYLDKYAKPGT